MRYGLIYGRIQPGDGHELGHFLEADVPGVVVARAPLTPLESFLVLGLMKLGLPAVVPSDFPYAQGRQVVADEPDDVIRALSALPNLRVKEVDGRTIRLPDYAHPAHAAEGFTPARRLGGPQSFLWVHQDSQARDGDTVVGQLPETGGDIGIEVVVADERADESVCAFLEGKARAALGLIQGVRAATSASSDEPFSLTTSAAATAGPGQMAEVIRRSLQFHYPRLGPVAVRVTCDPEELARLEPGIHQIQAERRGHAAALASGDDRMLFACTDCQPFSQEHVCFVGPTRPPMCGRDWREIAAGALFDVGYFPYKRRQDQMRANERPVAIGQCLDPLRGEYAGVNAAVQELSHGGASRVYLHSVRDHPHTSCGCFAYLAFWIAEAGGVGVMHRSFAGRAPNGETWDTLANKAGGKQWPGITGVGLAYLASPSFLRGDGGLNGVAWMTRKARAVAGPAALGIPTEEENLTLAELAEHLRAETGPGTHRPLRAGGAASRRASSGPRGTRPLPMPTRRCRRGASDDCGNEGQAVRAGPRRTPRWPRTWCSCTRRTPSSGAGGDGPADRVGPVSQPTRA